MNFIKRSMKLIGSTFDHGVHNAAGILTHIRAGPTADDADFLDCVERQSSGGGRRISTLVNRR